MPVLLTALLALSSGLRPTTSPATLVTPGLSLADLWLIDLPSLTSGLLLGRHMGLLAGLR